MASYCHIFISFRNNYGPSSLQSGVFHPSKMDLDPIYEENKINIFFSSAKQCSFAVVFHLNVNKEIKKKTICVSVCEKIEVELGDNKKNVFTL